MGYGDPFAPKAYRVRAPERAPDVPPLARLKRLGLDPTTEAEVRRRWAEMTNAERLESAKVLDNLDDDEVRRQIAEMTEPDGDLPLPSVEDVPSGTAAEVLAWVGEDASLARLALEAERARPQGERRTLVMALVRIGGRG